MRSALAALICAAVVAAAAGTGILFQPGAWYAGLIKPAGTPPNILFPIAWALLYIAMAVAAWLVWRVRGLGPALWLFGIQLTLNALWSPVVFGAHRLDLGLLVIVALWLAILATWRSFAAVRPMAGALLLPYLAWVGYAGYLNAGLLWLNA